MQRDKTRSRFQRYQTGLRAEKLAALLLRLKGFKIMAQRYKSPVGEIDLVARRGKLLIFVEVKARATMGEALESIQGRQTQRIIRAAEYYMAGLAGRPHDMRFDVIAVCPRFKIKHLPAAFTA